MGGLGSGTWFRNSRRYTLDSLKRIEISYLKKLGILNSYNSGTLSWTRNGEPNGFIRFQCNPSYIALSFNFRRGEQNEWQAVKQRIYFDTTPCNYGGVRYWLLCPGCQKRVGVLCVADKLFQCRHCYNVTYDSQNESRLERLHSKKDKIAKRIFEDYNKGRGSRKKKGMHQKTFDPLHLEYIRLNYQWLLEYDGLFARIHN